MYNNTRTILPVWFNFASGKENLNSKEITARETDENEESSDRKRKHEEEETEDNKKKDFKVKYVGESGQLSNERGL